MVPESGETDKSATDNVVIRNSERSFVRPRNATRDTGTEATKVNVPKSEVPLLNGA